MNKTKGGKKLRKDMRGVVNKVDENLLILLTCDLLRIDERLARLHRSPVVCTSFDDGPTQIV